MLAFSYSDFPDTGERKLYKINEKCLKPIAENNSPQIPKGSVPCFSFNRWFLPAVLLKLNNSKIIGCLM